MNFEMYAMLFGLIGIVAIVYSLSKDRSRKTKTIIWGLALMVAIAPLFSLLASKVYAWIEGDGWAGIALISILFPGVFLIGLVTLLIGIFLKEQTRN